MSRLIKANFSRLFRSIFFKICLLFSAGLGILLDLARYIDIQKNKEHYAQLGADFNSADGFAFIGAIYIIFAAAAFAGVFIGTEYSDGTVRNKLMIGHRRTSIYLANFIVCTAADILMNLIFIAVTLGFGRIIFSQSFLTMRQIIIFTLSQCLTMISFTALLTLITMLIQSKSGGSVTVLMMTIIMLFATLTIQNKLQEPEYYQDYSATAVDEETGEMVLEPITVKNPRYLTGTKRKVYEALNDMLPVNQFYRTATNDESGLNVMAAYSAVIIVLANAAGVILFRKKDLK